MDDDDMILEESFPDSRRAQKTMYDEKDYLKMTELEDGSLDLKLFLPPYELEYLNQGMSKQLTMFISASDRI